jgi:hypothetical protein
LGLPYQPCADIAPFLQMIEKLLDQRFYVVLGILISECKELAYPKSIEWYVSFRYEFLLKKKALEFGQNIFQPVIGQYSHEKRPSLFMVLSFNYEEITRATCEFIALFSCGLENFRVEFKN